VRAALPRLAAFFGLWLVLSDGAWAGLPFGVFAAAAACRASLALLPPGPGPGPGPAAWPGLFLLVCRQAVLGGADIAWRAFQARLNLQPGMVAYAPALPPGPARDAFATLASLAPGSLPTGLDAAGRMQVHALDTAQDVAADLAAIEARLAHG
jgi:multicomponent Na+:H+ antiporter subunit E